nr:hypothetical protein [uncultured Sphingomonas sp.]
MEEKLNVRARLERLKSELRKGINPTDCMLLARLNACGIEANGRYRCRTPACYRCRCINRRKQERETVQLFGELRNEDVAWITVVLGAASDVSELTWHVAKGRQDTRNSFNQARRDSSSWNGTHLKAWFEFDAVSVTHLPLLPLQRKELVGSLAPMATDQSQPIWLPTWHGLMKTNGISAEEVGAKLRRQWKLPNQIDVRLLDMKKALVANLENQAGYANKFHTTTTLLGGYREPWPVAWESKLFGWIDAAPRNPFESVRFSISPRAPKPVALTNSKPVEVLEPMPFILSSNSFPMYNNTGGWA